MNGLLQPVQQTSRFDNMHILLWLIKDTCWMLEWKVLGTAMIAPTIAVAIYLAYRTVRERAFWLNLAVCFWITANAYWMICEFAGHDELKNFAGIPFGLGLTSVAVFYIRGAFRSEVAANVEV